MALTYQPPPDWMIQEYMKQQKHPVAQAAEGAQGLLGTYMALQGQQQTHQLAQEDRDIKLAQLNRSGGSSAMDSLNAIRKARGLPPLTIPSADPSVVPPMASPMTTPSMGMPQPNFQPDSGAPAQAVSPGGSPILSFWGSSMGGQASAVPGGPTPPAGKLTHPEVGSDPAIQEFEQMGSQAYRQKYGDDGLTKVKQALDIQKGMQDKTKGPLQTITREQALKDGTFDASKQYIVDPPSNKDETRQERLSGSFRKELTSSKPYERFSTLKAASENIENAVKDPGAYGDLSTLFDYMKVLDPISVVREGEQEAFRKTGSLTQSMANTLNKVVNGQTVTAEQRAEVMKYTKSRLKTAHGIYRSHSEPTLRQAKRMGIDPLEVDPYYDYKTDQEVQTSTSTITKPEEEDAYQAWKQSQTSGTR